MRIVLTGGGTGGHIFPLVAVAEKLKESNKNIKLLYLGGKGELEKRIMTENSIEMKYVMSGKIRRYRSLANIGDIFKLPIGIIQALWHLLWYMPDVVFSKGGHTSVPVAFAAWVYAIPILTHESDSVPGLANRIIGAVSDRIAISYPHARRFFSEKKVFLTGNPIRSDISEGNKELIFNKYRLTQSKPLTLVLGGSQGSENINDAITAALSDLLKITQIIHQTGVSKYKETIKKARLSGIKEGSGGYQPVDFIASSEMKDYLAAADLVISRAGANSISDIAANAKPAILIPLASAANNHQGMNAYSLAEKGAVVVLEESNIGRNMLSKKIENILNDENTKEKLASNIKEFYHNDAAQKIADGIIDLAK